LVNFSRIFEICAFGHTFPGIQNFLSGIDFAPFQCVRSYHQMQGRIFSLNDFDVACAPAAGRQVRFADVVSMLASPCRLSEDNPQS